MAEERFCAVVAHGTGAAMTQFLHTAARGGGQTAGGGVDVAAVSEADRQVAVAVHVGHLPDLASSLKEDRLLKAV